MAVEPPHDPDELEEEEEEEEEAMPPLADGDPVDPAPARPWGAGGYEVHVYTDDEKDVLDFIRGLLTGVGKPTCEAMARYICGLEHFHSSGGPANPTAVGRALKLTGGTVYDLLNPARTVWSWRLVRHQAAASPVVKARGGHLDGIVVSHCFTDYEDPGAIVVCAHAFNEDWRILVSVRMAAIDKVGKISGLAKAHREVIEEIAALRAKISHPVPILAEAPPVGQQVIPHLAGSDLDYLIHLSGGWAEGGLIPAAEVGNARRAYGAGVSLRQLFPDYAGTVQSCAVRLNAWSQDVPSLALMAGPSSQPRAFLGGARGERPPKYPSRPLTPAIEQWAERWSQQDLDKAAANYGFGHFRSNHEPRFQRHYTMVALRDAYTVFKRAA